MPSQVQDTPKCAHRSGEAQVVLIIVLLFWNAAVVRLWRDAGVHLVGGAGSRTYALTSPDGAPALAPAVASAPGPAGKLSTPCCGNVNGSARDESLTLPSCMFDCRHASDVGRLVRDSGMDCYESSRKDRHQLFLGQNSKPTTVQTVT